MNDQTCDIKIKIESVDLLNRLAYDGCLSKEDSNFIQTQCLSINYEIRSDAEITVQFHQSYEIIELLIKMYNALYNIELCYSSQTMKFNQCAFIGMKSLLLGKDVIIEAKFICKARPGLPVEFDHNRC